ncbi:uncharacterized protein DKFZp434B061-like, partial [Homalodisca vitripennis]|uniref:uncharacterized protein DKFZp434B061-like n=1 Tax=Homalodisca vitripennis TaxID=197043 RepID=UPI001EEA04F5
FYCGARLRQQSSFPSARPTVSPPATLPPDGVPATHAPFPSGARSPDRSALPSPPNAPAAPPEPPRIGSPSPGHLAHPRATHDLRPPLPTLRRPTIRCPVAARPPAPPRHIVPGLTPLSPSPTSRPLLLVSPLSPHRPPTLTAVPPLAGPSRYHPTAPSQTIPAAPRLSRHAPPHPPPRRPPPSPPTLSPPAPDPLAPPRPPRFDLSQPSPTHCLPVSSLPPVISRSATSPPSTRPGLGKPSSTPDSLRPPPPSPVAPPQRPCRPRPPSQPAPRQRAPPRDHATLGSLTSLRVSLTYRHTPEPPFPTRLPGQSSVEMTQDKLPCTPGPSNHSVDCKNDALEYLSGWVAKKLKTSYRYLLQQFKMKRNGAGVTKLGRFVSVFRSEEETQLKEHVIDLDSHFYGLTFKDFRKLAFEFAETNQTPAQNGGDTPTKSMPNTPSSSAQSTGKIIQTPAQDGGEAPTKPMPNTPSSSAQSTGKTCPRQQNNVDCGVSLTWFAERLSRLQPIETRQLNTLVWRVHTEEVLRTSRLGAFDGHLAECEKLLDPDFLNAEAWDILECGVEDDTYRPRTEVPSRLELEYDALWRNSMRLARSTLRKFPPTQYPVSPSTTGTSVC